MSVTLLPSARPDEQRLTSAHRCVIARIQDLCIDVSQRTGYYACCSYSGHVHSITVTLGTHEAVERDDHSIVWTSKPIYLPPSGVDASRIALKHLTAIASYLEGLLPRTGGAA